MLLRRYEARTLTDALERVRRECGEDALVVETSATRNGCLVVAARPEAALPRSQARPAPAWTPGFAPLAARARAFGLSERLLAAVERALIGTRVELSRPGDPALPALCARILAALLHPEPRCEGAPAAPGFRNLALVGPTGVGKTTTLAKLAARAVADRQQVAIVSLDTYRVAAVEQLRAFADMLAVPCEVAFTPQDLRRALQRHAHADRVFVDTTGRSPRDREALRALAGTLGGEGTAAILCLAAGTRAADCEVLWSSYEPLGIAAVAMTKWDETVAPGEALSAVVERGLPLCHVTLGQEVPADIVAADPFQLAAAAFDLEDRR